MKYPVKKESIAYKIELTEDQIDALFGKGVNFRKNTNSSLFSTLAEFDGIIDVWFDFIDFSKHGYGISIRIDADKDTKELWKQILIQVEKFLKRNIKPT